VTPHFDLPLNLPHAAVVADRIIKRLGVKETVRKNLREAAAELAALLMICREDEDNPPPEEAEPLRQEALSLARGLVDRIEAQGAGEDRLGQLVRNLFECLAEGQEGAEAGLRAGENPDSLQRPWKKPG
jgi:hypothetical protein